MQREDFNLEERDGIRKVTRKLLWAWGHAIDDIQRLEQEREAFWHWANDARDTLHAQKLNGMPRGGKSSDLADVIDEVVRRAEMYEAQVELIDNEIADRIRLRNRIEKLVAQLTPLQKKVAAYRYKDGFEWRYIARKINYSERAARRIDDRIVDKLSVEIEVHNADDGGHHERN